MIERARQVLLDNTVRLWEQVDAEARVYRDGTTSAAATLRAAYVLLGAALCLVTIKYLGNEDDVKRLVWLVDSVGLDGLAKKLLYALRESPDRKINVRVFWCVSRLVCYGVLPALLVRFVLREKLGSYGWKGATSYRTYLGLFLVVLPFVVVASYSEAFQAKYPYYRLPPGASLWPNQVYWELLYGSQFLALEFFFRGYLIHGLKKVFGGAVVFVPVVPYVMIHFSKPLPETIGSAITGIVLGTLSLRTGSIRGGFFVHVGIAWSMDALSLWQRGFFGSHR